MFDSFDFGYNEKTGTSYRFVAISKDKALCDDVIFCDRYVDAVDSYVKLNNWFYDQKMYEICKSVVSDYDLGVSVSISVDKNSVVNDQVSEDMPLRTVNKNVIKNNAIPDTDFEFLNDLQMEQLEQM